MCLTYVINTQIKIQKMLFSVNTPPRGNHYFDLSQYEFVLPVLELHISRNQQHIPFCISILSFNIMTMRLFLLLCVTIFFSFSFLWSIPVWLYCTLSVLLSMDIYTVSSFSSVQFSRSVVSHSLQPNKLQHTRPPGPSPTPGVHSNSCPLCRWCHPDISSSVVPFSSSPQSLPASVFSNESTLCMRWPKYWSFSFSIIPSKEHPGLISFRMD